MRLNRHTENKIEVIAAKRAFAFLIDIIPLCLLFGLIGCFIGVRRFFSAPIYYPLLTIFAVILFCKDLISGQSLGKRIMKLKVVGSNESQNAIKLFIRNVTLLIWPVEAVLILKNKTRIGDRIAKTRVAEI